MVYFEKTQPAPASLAVEKAKTSGTYRQHDVLALLQNDFKNKCYLCEIEGLTSINVEHFVPHKGNRELEFDWNNFFFACPHCNNIKGQRTNLLNCTALSDEVDRKICYRLETFPKKVVSIDATEPEPTEKVTNTVSLLNDIYYGTTEEKKIESNNLRTKILREINVFKQLLLDYFDEKSDKTALKAQIEEHLSSASAFSAFKRWIIWENERFTNEFGKFEFIK